MNTLVSLPILAAVPTTAPAMLVEQPVADPVYAVIERHRKLSAAYDTAVNCPDVGDDSPEFAAVNDIADRTCTALLDHADDMFGFQPKSPAGVAALLRYIATLEEWQLPRGMEQSACLGELCKSLSNALALMSNFEPKQETSVPPLAPTHEDDPIFAEIAKCHAAQKKSLKAYARVSGLYKQAEKAGPGKDKPLEDRNAFVAARLGCDPDEYTDGPAAARWNAVDDALATVPTTRSGFVALLRFAEDVVNAGDRDLVAENIEVLLSSLSAAADALRLV